MSFNNRLARLERMTASQVSSAASIEERAVEENERLQAALAVMERTMSKEHVQLVVEAYAAGALDSRNPESRTPAARLLRRCFDALRHQKYRHWPDSEIADEVVLAMPPEVAGVYLREDALPLHDCEDCGFKIPVTPGEHNSMPARRHFDACPPCGGRVGWYAYFKRRKAEADTGTLDPTVAAT